MSAELTARPGQSPTALRALLPPVALVIGFALVPAAAAAVGDPFLVRLFTRIVVFATAAVALNIVLGFGGLVSLLHAALFGIGGYTVAILAQHEVDAEPLFGFIAGTSNLALSVPLALLVAGVAAAAMGAVSLRTSGSYFIMITLAFNQMVYYVFVALDRYGGEDGNQILADLKFAGVDVSGRVTFYFVALGVLAATLAFAQALVESRFGTVLRASAQNERRLRALGVPVLRYRLAAFVISGTLTGLAGAVWAVGQKFVSPADLAWTRSGDFVVMAVLGGLGTVWGPVVGATVFLLLELVLSSWTTYWQLALGILIVASAALFRGGLSDLWTGRRAGAEGGPVG